MRFVNIQHIRKALAIEKTRIDHSFVHKVKKALDAHFLKKKVLYIADFTFEYDELVVIIDQIKSEKELVFHDWVEQNEALSNYLLSNGEIVKKATLTIDSIKEHQLFEAYKSFLSPYLTSILNEKINCFIEQKDFTQLAIHLNYCILLPQSKEIEVQGPINTFIKKQIALLGTSKGDEFTTAFKFLFSSPFVSVLNYLNSLYYSSLVAYVDTAKNIVNQTQLDGIQLNKVKSSLLQLKLTSQHQKQVYDFCQSSVFKFKTPVFSSLYNWLKSPLFILGIVLIVFTVLILYWPQPKKQKKNFVKTTSGIDSLTNEELDQVDSLFGFKSDAIDKGEDKIISSSLNSKQYFVTRSLDTIKNKKAIALYSSLVSDYQIRKTKGLFGDCGSTEKTLYQQPLYDSVSSFSSKTTHTLRNKSSHELYILVFDPEKNGKIYGALVAPDKSLAIGLKKGQNIIFYSGKQMHHFNPIRGKNNGYGNITDAKKVIRGFNYHFCYQNMYNFQQLNKIYTVIKEKGLLVFKSHLNNGFEVKSKAIKLM